MNALDTHTITINVTPLDLAALHQLLVVNHALAGSMGHAAQKDLKALIGVLDGLIVQISIGINR